MDALKVMPPIYIPIETTSDGGSTITPSDGVTL